MQRSSMPWWRSDTYANDFAVPSEFEDELAGPKGIALVKAWPDGRTSQGWGLNPPKDSNDGFMPRYLRGEFNSRRVLYGYEHDRWSFAFVMRSMKLVCVDIDGKNGGFEHAKKLGVLPKTLAEVSKSGNGYHLFYIYPEEWNDTTGFGRLSDRIGIEQGVDIRAVGCVYHHKQQRWNDRVPVLLPQHLAELLLHRENKVAAAYDRIDTIIQNNDTLEVLMLHEEILSELKKPIPSGKRNNTLFAIGNQMRQAQVPEWEQTLQDRCNEVGLDADETYKLVENIKRYGDNAP